MAEDALHKEDDIEVPASVEDENAASAAGNAEPDANASGSVSSAKEESASEGSADASERASSREQEPPDDDVPFDVYDAIADGASAPAPAIPPEAASPVRAKKPTPVANAAQSARASLSVADDDYEGALLGMIMAKPDPRLYEVKEILPEPEFFADPTHRTTYGILLKLLNADALPSSLPLFANALYTNSQTMDKKSSYRRKFATQRDALLYINSITRPSSYTTAHAYLDYANFIRWESDKRELVNVIDDVRGQINTIPFEDREEFTTNVEERIATISTRIHERKGLHHISSSTEMTANTLDLLHSGKMLVASTKTGIHALDRKIGGFNPGEMIVLAGRPGAGKTAFAFQIALNVAQGHAADSDKPGDPQSVFLFNLEMMEEQITDRFVSNLARMSLDSFKKRSEQILTGAYGDPALRDHVKGVLECQYRRAKIALDYINKLPIELTAQSGLNPNTIKTMIQQKKRELERRGKPKLGLVVIDYLQLMSPATKQQSRETEVADISKRVKQMAKECDVPILLLSQLNRDADTDTQPDLKNLRESGSIEQDADKVIFLWNENSKKTPQDYRQVVSDERAQAAMCDREKMREKITIAKNRQGESGTVDIIFDWSTQFFASQRSEYASGAESFDEFFAKYYAKTRSGDDLFWPLTEAKMIPAMIQYQHTHVPELPYIKSDNTLFSYKEIKKGAGGMTIRDARSRQDMAAGDERGYGIDDEFAEFDDAGLEEDDDGVGFDGGDGLGEDGDVRARGGSASVDMGGFASDGGYGDDDPDDVEYDGEDVSLSADDKTENRIGEYGKHDAAEDGDGEEYKPNDGDESARNDDADDESIIASAASGNIGAFNGIKHDKDEDKGEVPF